MRKILLLLLSLAFLQGYAQQEPSLGTIYDRYGHVHNLEDLKVNKSGMMMKNSPPVACSTTSFFNLYFETGSGMEDISNPVHNARREVACRVFETLSNFINSPLTASGKKVNIHVRNMANTGAPPGVLGMASSYYITYSGDNATGGILDGEIWKTIHLGIDSYTNGGNPGNFYHGEMAFNFNDPNTQWHTNLSTLAPSTLYDLYTVMLHEVVHSLGFNSFINQDGESITGHGYYTRYDTFLKTNNTTFPLLTIGSCAMYDVSFNPFVPLSVLRPGCTLPGNESDGSLNNTLCNDAIKFSGTATVPVYTPTCFEPGSSLSHFEDQLFPSCTTFHDNDSFFVLSNSIGKGVNKRFLKGQEQRTMCDLGYSVKTTFGSSTNGIASGYVNYGGTVCGGITVAGLNDGVNSDGSYAFMGSISTVGGTSTNIAITGILSNDVNATGFECLQDMTAASTLSVTAGTAGTTINFTTTVPGQHILRYVPINGSQRGNITYIRLYIIPPPNPGMCSPAPTACNMVMNGDFEQFSELPTNTPPNYSIIALACGWNFPHTNMQYSANYYNTLAGGGYSTPCNISGTQACKNNIGNGYAYIQADLHTGKKHLYTRLKTPLEPNTTYQLSFDASLGDIRSANAGILQAYFTNTEVLPLTFPAFDIDISDPENVLSFPAVTTNTNGWDTITFTFTTTTGGEEYLYLGMLNNSAVVPNTPAPIDPSCYSYVLTANEHRGYYIDNVVLIPTNETALELPTAICTTQKLSDLRVYLSNIGENGVFSGPGVTMANGVYSFDAAVSGTGIITIGYTYTGSSGCPITLYDTINVGATTANPSIGDAINDNFTATPINSNTGGPTASVYTNDKYNGAVNPESISNVSFALVTPLSIPGATINATGAIIIPANVPTGTYTLTYRLSVLGNCDTTDTATAIIRVSTANESTLPTTVRANGAVRHLGIQSTGKIIIAGFFSTYNNITKNNIARLNTDLTLDPTFTYSGNNQGGNSLAVQSDNRIVIASTNPLFAGGTSCVTRLLADGAVDPNFNIGGVGTSKGPYSNNNGYAVAIQPNGRILVGGDFYYYNGQVRSGIARLLSDGTLDPSFVPTELNAYISSKVTYILLQPDGKIVLLGRFNIPSGSSSIFKDILRLNSNGSLDTNFIAGTTDGSVYYESLNCSIFSPLTRAVQQTDGKIVVVGAFTKYNGTNVNSIVRLLATNGQIDPTFNISSPVDRGINDVLMESGTMKILIAGEFSTFGGVPVKKMIRLNPNGTLDSSFNIGEGTTDSPAVPPSTCYNFIQVLKRQTDGKIIVGGDFLTFNGLPAENITRISGDEGYQNRGGNETDTSENEPQTDINQNFSGIKLYPNPSKDLFNIDLSQEREVYTSVSIFNILGEKVHTSRLTPKENNVVNLSHLAIGYYVAILENGEQTVTLKLIKN